jgi:DNA polymerase-3 subunit alpha
VPVDEVAQAGAPAGIRVFLEGHAGVDGLAKLLARMGREKGPRGPVHLCLMAEGLPGEVELRLPDLYPTGPQARGAIRSQPGVSMVEEV